MTTTQASEAGRTLVRRRWDRPENVGRRVERIASEIVRLPPLTAAQRDVLAGALRLVSDR